MCVDDASVKRLMPMFQRANKQRKLHSEFNLVAQRSHGIMCTSGMLLKKDDPLPVVTCTLAEGLLRQCAV